MIAAVQGELDVLNKNLQASEITRNNLLEQLKAAASSDSQRKAISPQEYNYSATV